LGQCESSGLGVLVLPEGRRTPESVKARASMGKSALFVERTIGKAVAGGRAKQTENLEAARDLVPETIDYIINDWPKEDGFQEEHGRAKALFSVDAGDAAAVGRGVALPDFGMTIEDMNQKDKDGEVLYWHTGCDAGGRVHDFRQKRDRLRSGSRDAIALLQKRRREVEEMQGYAEYAGLMRSLVEAGRADTDQPLP
jgi:hypothetical protein